MLTNKYINVNEEQYLMKVKQRWVNDFSNYQKAKNLKLALEMLDATGKAEMSAESYCWKLFG